MTYQTLYRKYRSNDLTELVGQQHVIQTLTNALKFDRLSHAYIFSGPRGTGKTSTARILAKMVNQSTDDGADCEICQKISEGTCVDVIEIDAASHTGVDHMRQLTEQIQFLPVEAKYKVFIIDEVHMLSTGAFNALLKTLEEPPAKVLFILATTELNKIPATIQSRAQTLHFRLLEADQIRAHLQAVCSKESVSIDDLALSKLVQVSNGGMRDALSFLDQLISVCDNQSISLSDISNLLGSLDDEALIQFLTACFDYDASSYQSLKLYLDQGMDIFQLYDDVVMYLHDVFLVKENHPFKVSDVEVSDWMQWFCDQLFYLKDTPSPGISAQVALYSRIMAMNAPVIHVAKQPQDMLSVPHVAPPQVVPVDDSPVVKQSPVRRDDAPSEQSRDVQPMVENAPAPLNNDKPQDNPIEVVESSVDVRPEKQAVHGSSDSKALCAQVLQSIAQEFQVLKPVLNGATLIQNNQSLCLILEETYQFFEKKLSEDKFKLRFLDAYNQMANASLSDWVVTSDVNLIYNKNDETTASDGTSMAQSAQSKTINQIVEMFEGQVIK